MNKDTLVFIVKGTDDGNTSMTEVVGQVDHLERESWSRLLMLTKQVLQEEDEGFSFRVSSMLDAFFTWENMREKE